MLDEWKEFQEYIYNKSDDTISRLKYGNLIDGKVIKLGGVPRALEIVARYAYYSEQYSPRKIKELLSVWCGYADLENIKDTYSIESGLFKHFDSIENSFLERINNCADKSKQDSLKKQIKNIKLVKNTMTERYERKVKNDDGEGEKTEKYNKKHDDYIKSVYYESGFTNDMNAIRFESIIADAIQKGPLKTYYLVLDKNPEECFGKNSKYVRDKILKFIAAFLLANKEKKNASAAIINYTDYSNWTMDGVSSGKKVKGRIIEEVTYEKELLFIADEIKEGVPCITINEKWLKEYNPRIVEYEDTDNSKDGEFIYRDRGSQFPMEKIKDILKAQQECKNDIEKTKISLVVQKA